MKTAYTPDNTRSSIVILLSIAVIVTVVAALIGLSDKPDVSTIVIAPAGTSSLPTQSSFGFGASPDDNTDDAMAESTNDAMVDENGEPVADSLDSAANDQSGDQDTGAAGADATRQPEGTVIVVPTIEPTPTPEVAAAVAPTPVPEESDAAATTGSVAAAPSLPTSAGMVEGSFFTKGDENDGATVAQNLISLSFAEDGSGAFQGVLDITYPDGTHILLNMSGQLTWAPTNPQVEATLSGAFTLDAPIEADNVTADDAELTISSLQAGSGSLCTTKCFGFTFPPQ